MKEGAAADVQRWSEEVALDPGAPSFVPLARTYRRQGRPDAARRVVLRGLEHNPDHVEAHALLALLYLEADERERAGDEWATVLRLDPENFEAHRGIGFLRLERDDLEAARRHLEAAARLRPSDGAVAEALELLEIRGRGRSRRPRPSADGTSDPARLFEPLANERPFLGALLLNEQGLILAGELREDDGGRGEALGAMLGPAVEEARRAAQHLRLGDWDGITLETDEAGLHLAALDGYVVLLATRRGAPAGWVVRTAERARELARRYVEGE